MGIRERRRGRAIRARVDHVALSAGHHLLIVPRGSHIEPELRRTWDDAQHHIDLARRRGEDAPNRDMLLMTPVSTLAAFARSARSPRSTPAKREPDITFPLRPPRAVDRDITPTQTARARRDANDHPLRQRGAGRASRRASERRGSRSASPAALVDRRVGWRIRHTPPRFPVSFSAGGAGLAHFFFFFFGAAHSHRPRDLPPRAATFAVRAGTSPAPRRSRIRFPPLPTGDYVVHLEHGVGIYRGIRNDLRRPEHRSKSRSIEYEGGDRLNVPLYRIHQLERYRAAERRRRRQPRRRDCTGSADGAGRQQRETARARRSRR